MHHVDGCERMVRHRSPSGFRTEYERQLFLSHIGPAVDKSIHQGTACYLEEPQWLALYQSLIEDSVWLSERSNLVIKVRSQLLCIGGIMSMANRAMSPGGEGDGGLLPTLELKARSAHQGMLKCLEVYKEHLVRTSMLIPDDQELAMRREIYGSILECLGIYKRIVAAVCDADRITLEAETQVLASQLLDLGKQPAQRHSWLCGHLELEVATILQRTKDEWEEDVSSLNPQEKRQAACQRWRNFNWCF